MKNMLNQLKEQLLTYETKVKNNEVSNDTSSIEKIQNEIETLKHSMEDIQASMEGKSKIEQMKANLNLSSIESEISLKELDLKEEKEKNASQYQKNVEQYNTELNTIKSNIEKFITSSEIQIEEMVKGKNAYDIILEPDFEEVKGYYKNIISVENNKLSEIRKKYSENSSTLLKYEEKRQKYQNEREWTLQRHINLCSNSWSQITNWFGEIDDDKQERHQEQLRECERDIESASDQIIKIAEEIKPLEAEKQKLEIQRESIEKKIQTIEDMVNEMIRELIQDLLQKEEITLPSFVPTTKYFNPVVEE